MLPGTESTIKFVPAYLTRSSLNIQNIVNCQDTIQLKLTRLSTDITLKIPLFLPVCLFWNEGVTNLSSVCFPSISHMCNVLVWHP